MFGHSGQNRNTGKKVEGIGGTQLNSSRMVDPSGGRPNIKAAIKFWKPRRGLGPAGNLAGEKPTQGATRPGNKASSYKL